EGRREEALALAEPHVRGRRLEYRAVGRDEQRVVVATARGFGLRRNVLRIARRLRARERTRRPRHDREPQPAFAQPFVIRRQRRDEHEPGRRATALATRRPEEAKRR